MFTSLTKEAFPVIRYRTRDLTRLLPPTSRSFRRLAKIVGRSDDMLIIRGVNVFPTQIEELILRDDKLSGQYQIVVSRDGLMDQMEVMCELQPGIARSTSSDEAAQIGRRLQQAIKALIGVSTKVSVMPTNSIERTLVGKAKRVIDKRLSNG